MGSAGNSPVYSTQIVLDVDVALHMRPAAMFAKFASQFESDVMIEYNNAVASAKSLLGIIMLGIGAGRRFTVFADGRDACEAVERTKVFFNRIMREETVLLETEYYKVEMEKEEVGMKKSNVKPVPRKQGRKAKKFQAFKWPQVENISEVCLAGDFNDWSSVPMERCEDGFQAIVELGPGEYEYKFIVDGEWKEDPSASKSSRNEFGTINSVVLVE